MNMNYNKSINDNGELRSQFSRESTPMSYARNLRRKATLFKIVPLRQVRKNCPLEGTLGVFCKVYRSIKK